jgi:SAM-dependent methyltransferase
MIPAPSATADIVCFFSVFTHLRHEQSYCYLEEARRVLRPTGRIIFSFLEFGIGSHWAVFEQNVAQIGAGAPLNQFISRDGIAAWARHLGLSVVTILDGDKRNIPIRQPIVTEGGREYTDYASLGQSAAVLALPEALP